MNFRTLWNNVIERLARTKGIAPNLFVEKYLMFALEILNPFKIENGARTLSKSLLLTGVALGSIPIVVTIFLLQKHSEIDIVTFVNNVGLILAFVRFTVYVLISAWFFSRLQPLALRVISERESSKDDFSIWQRTVDYYKKEFKVTSFGAGFTTLSVGWMIICDFFLKTNPFHLPYYFYVPSLPVEDSSINWMLNYGYQSVAASLTCRFFIAYVFVTMLLVRHSCWKVDVLIIKVEELDVIANSGEMNVHEQNVDKCLQEIIESNSDIIDWINRVQEILKFHYQIEFSLISLILSLCVYVIKFDPSVSFILYEYVAFPLSQLFIYCFMGNQLIIRIEQLAASVYDVKWYNMNVKQQKKIQTILVMAQNTKAFSSIFSKVNMETFQRILNFSYSLLTLMQSMN